MLTATDYTAPGAQERLALPAGVRPFCLNWPYIIVIAAYHGAAILAFMPGYFSPAISAGAASLSLFSAPICAACSASTFATTGFSPTAA